MRTLLILMAVYATYSVASHPSSFLDRFHAKQGFQKGEILKLVEVSGRDVASDRGECRFYAYEDSLYRNARFEVVGLIDNPNPFSTDRKLIEGRLTGVESSAGDTSCKNGDLIRVSPAQLYEMSGRWSLKSLLKS